MEMRSTDEQEFLAALGRRVRHMRALRGMSRKVLAGVSGISERYIAQLESDAAFWRGVRGGPELEHMVALCELAAEMLA